MFRSLVGVIFAWVSVSAEAIVIRHDVEPKNYAVDMAHAALVDMRHEGHGMLIAPQWVVTAAHTVFYDYKGHTIEVGGTEREIDYVIFHRGYSKPPEGIFEGDAAPSQAYLRANHDIALIKLKEPVEAIAPIKLYSGENQQGAIVTLYGKGNTGDGITGQLKNTKGTLRSAQNTVIEVRDQWLHYQFNQGPEALPLEGFQGNGDSGGPAILQVDGVDYLAGLASWAVYEGDLANFKGSIYGMKASLVRLSYYQEWIDDVMTWSSSKLEANHHNIQ